MKEEFTDILANAYSRTVTVRAADGRPMVQTKVLHAAAIGAAGIILAPRFAAAAALGALLAGVTLSVDIAPPEATEGGAA
ncbi:MAG TPA: hypothetical protein VJA44_05205 [Acidimicrobiia bacterium]|nr:hypothetical protein [Acidimicrobiia bacterium]